MDIGTINSAIIQGRWSNEDLTSMIDAIKFARAKLTKQNIRSITLKSNVEFTNSKTGQVVRGTVHNIAQKYVTVNVNNGQTMWRVPANMLTVV
jgi:LysM repeat protein